MSTGATRFATVVLQAGSMVVLARLLSPEAFAPVAIAVSIATLSIMINELGIAPAVVYARNYSEALLSTALLLNLVALVTGGALVAAAADPLSEAFRQPELRDFLVVVAATFPLSAAAVPAGILHRNLEFWRLGATEFISQAIGVATSISLVTIGSGPLGIVIGGLVGTLARTLSLWALAGWVPRVPPQLSLIPFLSRFGGHLTGSGLVNYGARNADNFALGRFASAAELGLYSRAFSVVLLPIIQVGMVFGRVLFPLLAGLDSRDAQRLKWLKAATVVSTVAFPVGIGIALVSGPLVAVLFGTAWAGMAPIVAVLAISTPPQIVTGGIVSSMYQALGATRTMLRVDTIQATLTVIAILIGVRWGALGVAWGLALKAYLAAPISVLPLMRRLSVTARQLFQAVLAPLVATMLMVVIVLPVLVWTAALSPLATLTVAAVSGSVVYIGALLAFPSVRALVGEGLLQKAK